MNPMPINILCVLLHGGDYAQPINSQSIRRVA